jgi:hypothetical protein
VIWRRAAALFVSEREADSGGKLFYCLVKTQVIELLHELINVATLAAAEAFVETVVWLDCERWRLFVVKGAQTLQ